MSSYAVVMGLDKYVNKFQSWLTGGKITVLTDHRAFEHWTTEVLGPITALMGRRGRWHEFLSHPNLEVAYIKGPDNIYG